MESVLVKTFKTLLKFMLGSIRDLAPIIVVILFFQLVVIQQPLPNVGQLLLGVLFVLLGLTFFIHGLEQGLFPIGESMAHAFARKGSVDHTHYDTASILRLITRVFKLDTLNGIKQRDNEMLARNQTPFGDLTNALTFSH